MDHIEISGAPRGWQLRKIIELSLAGLHKYYCPGVKDFVLSVSCVGSPKMSQLNWKYRHKKGPTDVLSFELREFRRFAVHGDLVLCIPVVRNQAHEYGHTIQIELATLVIHGLLHLLGFDHVKSKSEARKMACAEQRLLDEYFGIKQDGLIGRAMIKKRPYDRKFSRTSSRHSRDSR